MVPPPHADMPSPRANDANRARASRPNQLNFMCFLHPRRARPTLAGMWRNLSWREYKPSSDCSGGRAFLPFVIDGFSSKAGYETRCSGYEPESGRRNKAPERVRGFAVEVG